MNTVLEALRFTNVGLSLAVGLHLVITFRSASWTRGHPYVRFLRLGTGYVFLVLTYGAVSGIIAHRPPTLTTLFLFVGYIWAAIGTVWTIAARADSTPPAPPAPQENP